jgi:hypothetical protein
MTKEFRRRIRMVFRLARRGAWLGVWKFSASLVYGLTHRRCKQCGTIKGLNVNCRCYSCQYTNLMLAISEEFDDK